MKKNHKPSHSKLKAKSQLRHQMTEEDRQRNDTEMENWAVEHERRKEEGYFPKGVESEEGKICWESMCWVLKFEWNYSQNRHQIMKAGISEEDELKSILHSLADFQDAPPNIPTSENCAIEKAYISLQQNIFAVVLAKKSLNQYSKINIHNRVN